MERLLNIQIEKLPEGVYLATSEDLPGLVAQRRTITETLEIAQDVARKLIEARSGGDLQQLAGLQEIADRVDYQLIVSG
ncbi:MAG: type II toxin-antitoxin system HicB family antitoxin [Hormoscilla sp. SP5CHS1]|nr:type II toxin-antitoxin system HicB family antitoxin [Hormoscilla sp. SP12CHS1]MBC6455093.1 type II toxin-antitoxin system HicB family antitoxin [Hormoscilla sp. SP5CHS1]